MKKAFTLIELLVVIAIIAILAAILFPVFAQARTAAKKTAAISNQKQISLGVMMYIGDNDERYAMRSGCELNSSLNPALNVGTTLRCSSGPGFAHSMTWQSWQKYYQPYIKNVELFNHPLRQKDSADWNTNGQIKNAFVINLGLTGAAVSNFISTPFTGGTQSGINSPSATMLLMEMPNSYAVSFAVPTGLGTLDPVTGLTLETVYPLATKEYWEKIIYKTQAESGAGSCTLQTPQAKDTRSVGAADGFVVGFADGSAKFFSSDKFLGSSPTAAQYGVPFPGTSFNNNCRRATSAYTYSGAAPNTAINFPFWGLGN